jgi:chromosome segregation ATPase
VAEDERDTSAAGQTPNLGAGKDLLFGWLVGRAAADLGLAQALAASEAQRVEQIKRLEDSLLAQIRELQSQASLGASADKELAELGDLKATVDRVAERLSRVEALAQETAQARDQFQTHAANLQSDLARQRALHEAQSLRLQELGETLSAKFRELKERAQGQSPAEADFAVLRDVKFQLDALTARVEQAELVTHRLQTQASEAAERLREQTAGLVQSENAALKAELFEHFRGLPRAAVGELEAAMNERMETLRREFSQDMVARLAPELESLRIGLESVTQRLDSAPPPAPLDLDAERKRWTTEVDQNMRRLGDEIRQELHRSVSGEVGPANIQAELSALADRIARAERAAQQTAENLNAEMAAVREGVSRQQERQQATDALLESLEKMLRAKFEEIQSFFAREQDSFRPRDGQSAELKTEMQRLAQRMADLESAAHRTHALLINENQQTAQLRESLRAEIDEVRGRLNDRPSLAAALESVESQLGAKLREVESQLGDKMRAIERRDSEIRELKAEIQTIRQTMMALDSASVSHRPTESGVAPVEPGTLRAPEERSRAASARPAGALFETPATLQADAGPKGHLLVEAGEEQIAQLHERISADIERVRAELREKSGRWKARR